MYKITKFKGKISFITTWLSEEPMRLLLILIPIIFVFFGFAVLFAWGKESESIFDALVALFSGLAFAGMICTLLQQKQELSLQRQELKDTRAELEKTRKATERQAEIIEKEQKIKSLLELYAINQKFIDSNPDESGYDDEPEDSFPDPDEIMCIQNEVSKRYKLNQEIWREIVSLYESSRKKLV